MRKRAMAGPPPELLLLSRKATIPQLRKAVAAALRDTYRMFNHVEVTCRYQNRGIDDGFVVSVEKRCA